MDIQNEKDLIIQILSDIVILYHVHILFHEIGSDWECLSCVPDAQYQLTLPNDSKYFFNTLIECSSFLRGICAMYSEKLQ